ncbi:hypothetical protein ElyMa_005132300 [Elysia marginata]|uniref:Uncharacterized protein n=1 Tax=Elysia marginata TaxID=1093978 RepID=A0AAV4JNC0_9GAST|nr:hypothetical protein ElyMa_005132300 [Elysia marginata]
MFITIVIVVITIITFILIIIIIIIIIIVILPNMTIKNGQKKCLPSVNWYDICEIIRQYQASSSNESKPRKMTIINIRNEMNNNDVWSWVMRLLGKSIKHKFNDTVLS